MYYVYLLLGKLNKQIYIGSANNLKKRVKEHNEGKVVSTKRYRPWILFYYEAYLNEKLSRLREKRLKYNGNALRELKKRIGLLKSSEVSKNLKSGAGFTISELLIVMGIMAVLIGFVIVNLERAERSRELQHVSTQLQQDFRLAQGYTIAGNSINFCATGSSLEYYYCNCLGEMGCCGGDGLCKNGVPLGGYGIRIASTENYTIYGDKNNSGDVDPDPNLDYQISFKDTSLKRIHISQFQLGSQSPVTPSDVNYVSVLFEPPLAKVHFYARLEGLGGLFDSSESELKLLIKSDYISGTCRIITINRISGKISESQGECSL